MNIVTPDYNCDFAMQLIHILLLLSVVFTINGYKWPRLARYTTAITVTFAVIYGTISPLALLYLTAFGYIAYYHLYHIPRFLRPSKLVKIINTILAITFNVMVCLFIKHRVPGFNNLITSQTTQFSLLPIPLPTHNPFYINFDKIMVVNIICMCSNYPSSLTCQITKHQLRTTLCMTIICISGAFMILLITQIPPNTIIRNTPLWSLLPIWLFNNLFFVCFSEEVIFRGYLQSYLTRILVDKEAESGRQQIRYSYYAIILSALYFGCCHIHMGNGYYPAILSGLGGLLYGYNYYRTQNIPCNMMLHFLLNLSLALLAHI